MKQWKYYLITFCIGIIPFLFLSKTLFLIDPPVWPDEAIFTSIAKHVKETGVIATHIYGDNAYGISNGAYFNHPFYYIVLSMWGRIFGFTIESVRMLSVSIGLLTLLVIFITLLKLIHKPYIAVIGLWLISLDFWFSRITRLGRMEIMTIFWSVLAFLCFLLLRESKHSSVKFTICICVCTALAFLTHPIGISSCLIIVILLIYSDIPLKIKIRTFSIIVCLTILPWLLWFLSIGDNLPYYFVQMNHMIIRKNIQIPYTLHLFQSGNPWVYVATSQILMLLCSAFFVLYKFRKGSTLAKLLLVPAVVSCLFIYYGKEMWYTAYSQPWIIYLALSQMYKKQQNKIQQIIFIFLLCLFLWGNYLIYRKTPYSKNENYRLFGSAIASSVPRDANILVSSIPDPTFELWNYQGEGKIYSYFLIPMNERTVYYRLLDTIDYVVINMYQELVLPDYIRKNIDGIPQHVHIGNYEADIIKLLPTDMRSH